MIRSNQAFNSPGAMLAAGLLLVSGTAAAYAGNGEHTDWPDYPEGSAVKKLLSSAGGSSTSQGLEAPPRPREKPQSTPWLTGSEHTDWPDYPEGNLDPSYIGTTPDKPGDPNTPNVVLQPIPSLDELLAGTNPAPFDGGFAGTGATPGNLPGPAPVPAPGSVMLLVGLGAAASRRRRA
jgi:hypothetical protein